MTKLYSASQERQTDTNTRTLTKKVIANYSYVLTDAVGQGYSSKVYRGVNDTTNCPVAIKAIDMSRINNEIHHILLQSEIECLIKMSRCQHVIQFLDVNATVNNTYIITEFCDEGDLSKLINPRGMTQSQAVTYMKQIIAGYLEIYRKGIVHRDLKPTNIFMKNKLLKIADFGFAMGVDDCKKHNNYNIGSPLYMPPEALLYNQYSYKSDIWALGIIFYELLTGVTPWNANTEIEFAEKIKSDPIFRRMPDHISIESIDFLTRTLQCSVNDRMTPEQLKNFQFGTKDGRFNTRPIISGLTGQMNRLVLKGSYRISHFDGDAASSPKIYTMNEIPPPPMMSLTNNDDGHIPESMKKETSKQLLAQIHLCRFLFKLVKRLEHIEGDSFKLKEYLSTMALNKLSVLCSCESNNPFGFEYFKEYKTTSDFFKFIGVAKQYETKYKDELASYVQSPLQSDNFDNILYEIRAMVQTLYVMLRDIPAEEAPSHQEYIILIDYLVTTYQLVQLAARGDICEFSRKSKIDTIMENHPTVVNYSHFKAVEDKLVQLAFI